MISCLEGPKFVSQGRNVDRINFLMASLSPAFISYDYDEEQWEDNCFAKMQQFKKRRKKLEDRNPILMSQMVGKLEY